MSFSYFKYSVSVVFSIGDMIKYISLEFSIQIISGINQQNFSYLSEGIISSKILQNQIFENVKTQQDTSSKKLVFNFE